MKAYEHGSGDCKNRFGKEKRAYDTDKEAISEAKRLNEVRPNQYTKLVAYKCGLCHKFHLTSTKKSKKEQRKFQLQQKQSRMLIS